MATHRCLKCDFVTLVISRLYGKSLGLSNMYIEWAGKCLPQIRFIIISNSQSEYITDWSGALSFTNYFYLVSASQDELIHTYSSIVSIDSQPVWSRPPILKCRTIGDFGVWVPTSFLSEILGDREWTWSLPWDKIKGIRGLRYGNKFMLVLFSVRSIGRTGWINTCKCWARYDYNATWCHSNFSKWYSHRDKDSHGILLSCWTHLWKWSLINISSIHL